MHEFIYNTKDYKITVYLKNPNGKNITVKNCFEIQSSKIINLNGFKTSGNLYFPDVKLQNFDNQIHLLIIEKFNKKNLRNVLNKLLPTVFDIKHIKRKNFSYFLYLNRYLILDLAKKILGNHKIIKNMWNKIIDAENKDNFYQLQKNTIYSTNNKYINNLTDEDFLDNDFGISILELEKEISSNEFIIISDDFIDF